MSTPQFRIAKNTLIILVNLASMAALTGCTHSGPTSTARLLPVRQSAVADDPLADMPMTAASDKIAVRIVNRAKSEVRLGVVYDAAYRKILYPGGDVPPDRGACTDVVIRSLRSAGFDLQTLIHRDMLRNQSHYAPGRRDSGLDSNIDHRRVPNQRAFMKYHATVLPVETSGAAKKSWQPGDIVYWKLENGLDHCGVVSNCIGQSGLPMVIHNLAQAAQEDVLTTWKITGHYRFPARKQAGAGAR